MEHLFGQIVRWRHFSSSDPNQFNVRASGGVQIFTSPNLSSGVTLEPGFRVLGRCSVIEIAKKTRVWLIH